MPSYGTQIFNSGSAVQVDGVYKNFGVHAAGSATLADYNTVVIFPTLPYWTSPIVLVHSTKKVAFAGFVKDVNGNYTGFRCFTEASNTIDYAILVPADALPVYSDSHGLLLYDAAGAKIFDSRNRYFNVVDVVTIPLPADANTPSDFTHASVSNPYYLLGNLNGWVWYPGGGQFYVEYRLFAQSLSTTSGQLSLSAIGPVPEFYLNELADNYTVVVCELLN
ncbi:MAG: hypothetical protein ACOY5C_02850 [Pseudomonadota bacterium]